MEFLRIARESKLPVIASVQNCYNLINRGYEFSMAEIGYREQLSLLAYSPLAFGHLTGKYLEGGSGRATLFKGFAQRYEKTNVEPACAAYAALARRYEMTPAELALSFVYHRWFVTSTIIGATNMQQLQENIHAWTKPLPDEALKQIEQLHLRFMNPAP
jgi:aryl-alcohol dehydrogenase-like predicted oxidoreductase